MTTSPSLLPASRRRDGIKTLASACAFGVVAIAWLGAVAAHAGTDTKSLNISTSISDSCTVSGGTGSGLPNASLDFGIRDALATGTANAQSPSSGNGALQVVCSSSIASATLTLSAGANAGGSSLRRLSGPGAVLVDYALYRDSGRTQFIDTNPFVIPSVGAGVPYVLVVYGRLPAPSQATAEGNYSDAVSITLSY